MARAAPTFADCRDDYVVRFARMRVAEHRAGAVDRMARVILDNSARYRAVEGATGVPWVMVGLIHAMEASCDFRCHLHNGDPLTLRTRQVPRGRPLGSPPFSWQASAIDALTMPGKAFHRVTDWSLARVAYCLEAYNGWGYRLYHAAVPTPYLWSWSSEEQPGKYVADGKWDRDAWSEQPGAMALLKAIIDIDAGAAPWVLPEAGKAKVLPADPVPAEPADADHAEAAPAAPDTPQATSGGSMLSSIFAPLTEILGKVLDKAIPDATERERAKAEIMAELARNDAALTQAARDTIVAEAQGESWMQRNWRPSLMFVIMGLIIWAGVVVPLLSAVTGIAFAKLLAWYTVPEQMWSLLQLGVGGYIISRGGEKMIDTWASTKGAGPAGVVPEARLQRDGQPKGQS